MAKAKKPANVPKNAAATVVVPAMKVYVRESFYTQADGECWFPGSGIADLTFEIDGKAVAGKKAATNRPHKVTAGLVLSISLHSDMATKKRAGDRATSVEASEATLSLAGVADGEHQLRVVPPPKQTTTAPAGPALTSKQDRMYRELHIRFNLKNGKLTAAKEHDPANPKVSVNHGHVTAFKDDELCIDLKPDWLKTTVATRSRKQAIDVILVHHTGGRFIGGALNEALTAKGPHYEIDPEGHAVKFVSDNDVSSHAGSSWWDGKPSCNSYGIGIELVHWQPFPAGSAPVPAYEPAQYASLIRLLKDLVKAHKLPAHRIVGHSDVRTQDPTTGDPRLLSGDRQTCPGGMFEWTQLEAAGLGMIPKAGVLIGNDWGGYFAQHQESLRFGDSDSKGIYGGKARKGVAGVIAALQADLLAIGYSVHVTGEFDAHTREAVDRFKRHFFTGTRQAFAPPNLAPSHPINSHTASTIRAVLLGIQAAMASPPAPAPAPAAKPPATPPHPDGGVRDATLGTLLPGIEEIEPDGDHAYAVAEPLPGELDHLEG